jgi:hypothetical protein
MIKLLVVPIFLLLACPGLFSQTRSEDFEINLPEQKVQNSLYKTLKYIDSRYDTTYMGIVQLGAFNRKAKVIPKIPFSTQLTNVINAMADSTAKDGELLLQLRQFNFAEITGAVSEKGYCYIRASLYSNKNGSYQKISSIDTVILVKSMDVTRAMLRNGSKTITDFIATNLLQETTDSNYYSYDNIVHIDSIEKRKIIVYNTPAYTDGLYATFNSFLNQTPDKPIIVEMKGEKISSVKTPDENGKKVNIKARDIYSIVYKGQPFIATTYGYYPLQKLNDDFFFTGKAKVTANTGDVVVASLFFGIIGGLIASDAEATFEMKIDHINGGFIRLREIKTNAD